MVDRNVLKHGEEFFRLVGHFEKEKDEKVVAKVIPGVKKEFELNDVQCSKLADHIGRYPIVVIIPDDTQLATEGSETRRRFLDNTLSQLDRTYLMALMDYNKLLKQRNVYLKTTHEHDFNENLVNVYDQQMSPPAQLIFEKRKALIELINPYFLEVYKMLSNDHEQVSLSYRSQLNEAKLLDLRVESMEKDRILTRTTTGIHKDELTFKINGKAVKRFASQGQLKSFVLALKLAQYELIRKQKNISPILLLDDIFDKLDERRVESLIALLMNRNFGQIFITDTHKDRASKIIRQFDKEHTEFMISNGTIKTLVQ